MSPKKHEQADDMCLDGLPLDAQMHIRDCERRWGEMESDHLPALRDLRTDRKIVVAVFVAFTFAWGAVGWAVSSGIQAKIDATKLEMIQAVRQGTGK